ncbi:MAG TPA: O-antigen ligase family protein [Gaiellaceae bacterium]|nr:O-antigen ligase family protein [Gaiellaceae bacterium]
MASALAAFGLALVLSVALAQHPLPLGLVFLAGAALVGTLALALAHYDAAVGLGVALLGVVVVDPAPADLVFVVVIAVAAASGRFDLDRVPKTVIVAVVVFAALNLVSSVEVIDPARAAGFFSITLYLAVLALWLTGYVVSPRRARVIARGYVFAAVTSALLGSLALLLAFPGASLLIEDGRARAFFQDPNVFGPFLVPAALILVEELLAPRVLRASRFMKAIGLVAVTLGVLFSFSRGAWLNLALGVVVVFVVLSLRRGGARRALAFLGVGLCVAALVGGAVAVSGSSGLLVERARPQSYDAERFGAQAAGLDAAEKYPLGAGPGQFEQIAPISAHSTYVRVLAEQGLAGLVTLAALLIFTLGAAVRNALLGRDTYGIGSAALLGAWCGILANSFFVDTLHWRHLWLVAALIWAGSMRRRTAGRTRPA